MLLGDGDFLNFREVEHGAIDPVANQWVIRNFGKNPQPLEQNLVYQMLIIIYLVLGIKPFLVNQVLLNVPWENNPAFHGMDVSALLAVFFYQALVNKLVYLFKINDEVQIEQAVVTAAKAGFRNCIDFDSLTDGKHIK